MFELLTFIAKMTRITFYYFCCDESDKNVEEDMEKKGCCTLEQQDRSFLDERMYVTFVYED